MLPTDLSSFLDLIRQNGDAAYSLLFAYATSHALLFGLFAGYAAFAGALKVSTLIIVFWIGSFLGDVMRFYLGRRYGGRLFSRWPRIAKLVNIAARLTDKHPVLMVLFHRYPHGIRGVAAFAYGLSNLSWPTFLVLNFFAAGLWSVVIVAVGYAFGSVSEKLMNDASSGFGIVTLIIFLGLSWVLSKKLESVVEDSVQPQAGKK